MSTRHLVDPDLLPLLDLFAGFDVTSETYADLRAGIGMPELPIEEPLLTPRHCHAPGRDGAPDVALLVYTPPGENARRPAILHIHGGGMVIGSADMSRMSMPPIALAFDAVAVSVEYRLAPETPFPGPQEDCYAALQWLVANADALGVDPARIVVMGESAGGGLAAALTLMVRDRGEYRLSGQVLVHPMLDHRTGGPDCPWRNPGTGEFFWKRGSNRFGWESLRGGYAVDDDRRGWFSPALATDLSGLPPAFVSVGTLDLFLDEDVDYVRRLTAAGVPAELHCYPGAIHAYHAVRDARVTKQSNRDLMGALARLL
jgi:acetyl esterase